MVLLIGKVNRVFLPVETDRLVYPIASNVRKFFGAVLL